MARAAKMYRRLPGRAASLASYHRLWLGPDHLLSVRATGYSEEYKRFYFRDIQAILIGKKDSWKTWNLIWGSASGLVVFIGLMSTSGGALFFWLGLGGFLFLLLLVNLLSGPTCVCHIRTAVQTEPLPTLKRLRTARQVIMRLKPRIEEAQGVLAAERLQAKAALGPVGGPAGSGAPSGIVDEPPPPTSSHA